MNQNDDSKEMLGQALGAADDWLRKQGVLTDFSFNTILAWLYVNFEKIQNVELDVDRPNQRIYIRIYLSFWTLVIMTILRRKDQFLDLIFGWLSDYVPTYQVEVRLLRYKGPGRLKSIDLGPTPEAELPEESGNVIEALKAKKEASDKKPTTDQA
jgi:hypothetical protein